jgi:hypothetical protein
MDPIHLLCLLMQSKPICLMTRWLSTPYKKKKDLPSRFSWAQAIKSGDVLFMSRSEDVEGENEAQDNPSID